jgi:hypothetical protein
MMIFEGVNDPGILKAVILAMLLGNCLVFLRERTLPRQD